MFEKFINKLEYICTVMASVALGIVFVTVIANVIGRFLGTPIRGMYEITTYGSMTAMCLALCRTAFMKKHVRVEIVSQILPKKPKAIFEFFQMLIPGALFTVVFYLLCFKLIPEMVSNGRLTDIFRIPYYVVYSILALGMLLSIIMFFYHAVLSVSPLFTKSRGKETKDIPKCDTDE